MIKLTKEEQQFIKNNKSILAGLFSKRVEDLKEQMLLCKPEEIELKRQMINEFKSWLLTIKIFSKRRQEKKDTGI